MKTTTGPSLATLKIRCLALLSIKGGSLAPSEREKLQSKINKSPNKKALTSYLLTHYGEVFRPINFTH